MFDWLRKRLDARILQAKDELSVMQKTVRQEEEVLRARVGRYMGEHIDQNHGVLYRLGVRLNRLEFWRRVLG